MAYSYIALTLIKSNDEKREPLLSRDHYDLEEQKETKEPLSEPRIQPKHSSSGCLSRIKTFFKSPPREVIWTTSWRETSLAEIKRLSLEKKELDECITILKSLTKHCCSGKVSCPPTSIRDPRLPGPIIAVTFLFSITLLGLRKMLNNYFSLEGDPFLWLPLVGMGFVTLTQCLYGGCCNTSLSLSRRLESMHEKFRKCGAVYDIDIFQITYQEILALFIEKRDEIASIINQLKRQDHDQNQIIQVISQILFQGIKADGLMNILAEWKDAFDQVPELSEDLDDDVDASGMNLKF